MARFSSFIIGPIIMINLAGIITIFCVEQNNMTSNNRTTRTLSNNKYYNNLRGSKKLKIQINEEVNTFNSTLNKEFEISKFITENNKSQEALRKLSSTSSILENQYILIANLVPLALVLILICSFCAEEDGSCECCDGLNEDTYYTRTSYDYGYSHYRRETHRPRPMFTNFNFNSSGRSSSNDDKKKNEAEAVAYLICFVIILVIILVLMVFLIPRACGKTASRYFSLGFLSLFYLGLTALYSIKLYEGNYNSIYLLFGVSLSLLICNFISIFLPSCINACRRRPDNNLNNKSVETPLYTQEL